MIRWGVNTIYAAQVHSHPRQNPIAVLVKNIAILLKARNRHSSILIYNLTTNKRQSPVLAFIYDYVVYHFRYFSLSAFKNREQKQYTPVLRCQENFADTFKRGVNAVNLSGFIRKRHFNDGVTGGDLGNISEEGSKGKHVAM